jgi:AcrR family transcriptional regulator
MARPDLTEVRTPQILDAFARCVARYGLEGASLEQIAEEAGVKRSLLRHYVGNRDEMVAALAERVVESYREDLDGMLALLPKGPHRVKVMVDYLFPRQRWEPSVDTAVTDVLIGAADRYPAVHEIMKHFTEDLFERFEEVIREGYPQADRSSLQAVVYGIISLSFTHESLMPLGLPISYAKSAQEAAMVLVRSLAR